MQLELLEGASAAQWAQIAEGGIDGLGRLPPPEGQAGIEVLALGGEPLVVAVPNGDRWRGKSGSACTICAIGR